MWWLTVLFLSVFGMGVLYLYADTVKHNRALAAQKKADIDEAKRKLKEALNNAPEDLALHAALRDALLRLQERK
jgi:hypothetical protein